RTLLFCSGFRLPPRSTLFPYTTLFRSQRQPMLKRDLKRYVRGKWTAKEYQGVFRAMKDNQQIVVDATDRYVALSDDKLQGAAAEDRKSTGLNSSHVKISYAVFCLKKKN